MDEHGMTMQLFFSPGSPFARKVRVLVRERGLLGHVQETALSPHDDAPELLRTNPLGKVPALHTPELLLFDSQVICEYLDTLEGPGAAPRFVPPSGPERIAALRGQALGDGLMDAAVASVLELRRPRPMQSPHWLRRWRQVVERAVDALADARPPARFDIAAVSIACGLAYLDFRFADIAWRDAHPSLAAWLDEVSMRDSMRATRPPV
jgi:glutathione S-transferase